MKISDNGLNLIKSFEGLELTAYLDTGHVWTIGFGHTKGVKEGQSITREQADIFLMNDIASAQSTVNSWVKVPLSQNQYDALVSFVYNVGGESFRKSSMLRFLNSRQYVAASQEFDKWTHDNGHVVKGLENRRKAEKFLFKQV
jgi:lysozyme